jgi:hypothetical protein
MSCTDRLQCFKGVAWAIVLPVGRLRRIFRREMGKYRGPGFAYLFSGLNFQVIGGGTSSMTSQVVVTTRSGVLNGFEGANAAGEQQAGSTAASSFAPAVRKARQKHAKNKCTSVTKATECLQNAASNLTRCLGFCGLEQSTNPL